MLWEAGTVRHHLGQLGAPPFIICVVPGGSGRQLAVIMGKIVCEDKVRSRELRAAGPLTCLIRPRPHTLCFSFVMIT